MHALPRHCPKPPPGHAGFGLVDALVALALLAVTLLGACSSLHFAMRATHAAAWRARAVDLVADLDEDLQQADPAQPLGTRLEPWRIRLQQDLPAANLASIEARQLEVGPSQVRWVDVQLTWNGTPGQPRASLGLSLAHSEGR